MRSTISRLLGGGMCLVLFAAGAALSCNEHLTSSADGGNTAVGVDAGAAGAGGAGAAGAGGVPVRRDAGSSSDARRGSVPPSDSGTPTTDCSLLGSWYLTSSHGDVYSHDFIAFEADGSYYGGANGADLPDNHAFDGQYTVSGSTFNLISSSGDGTCTGPGTFDMQFQSNCALAILNEQRTACTGNRTAVAGEVILIQETADAGMPPGANVCPPIPPTDPGNPATGCSMVGLWSLSSSHGSTGLIEFQADGSYYGGPTGVDLTQAYQYDGEYSVSGSTFNLVFSCGDGTCTGSGTFDMQFQSDCAAATLTERVTECTGGRTAVAGTVALTRMN